MLNRIIISLLLICLSLGAHSQRKIRIVSKDTLRPLADCDSALLIKARGRIGPIKPVGGFGNNLDISGNSKKSKYYFSQEHNTAWFKFTAPKNGNFTFEIIPLNQHDDYDFLLFEVDSFTTCPQIRSRKINPVRTNIARYDTTINGKTGLNMLSNSPFAPPGPGDSYSKALEVNKGQNYYLVVDNSFKQGSGFNLRFHYYYFKDVSGEIIDDETSEPVQAEVSWEDASTGEVLAKTKTDKMGNYRFKVPFEKKSAKQKYVLSAEAEEHFFSDTILNAQQLSKADSVISIIVLPKLKLGKRITLSNISFFGGSPTPLPQSKATFKRLLKCMKKNKSLNILIEGHTNGPGLSTSNATHQSLSDRRAKTVQKFLNTRGIDENRISTIGYGCKQMLYPQHNATEAQQSANRRVEIKVTGYK